LVTDIKEKVIMNESSHDLSPKQKFIMSLSLHWKYIVPIILAIIVLFFGNAILLKPRIKVQCGAISLRTPAKYIMELAMIRLMLVTEDIGNKYIKDFVKELKNLGFPEEKIDYVVQKLKTRNKKNEMEINKKTSEIDLEPHEEMMIKIALAKAASNVGIQGILKAYDIPTGVLFFDITNSGLADAKNTHIVVRLKGSYYNMIIDTDNQLINKKIMGNRIEIDLKALTPKSRTKGIIWYKPSGDLLTTEELKALSFNEITVTYENGTVRKEFKEEEFFLSED